MVDKRRCCVPASVVRDFIVGRHEEAVRYPHVIRDDEMPKNISFGVERLLQLESEVFCSFAAESHRHGDVDGGFRSGI